MVAGTYRPQTARLSPAASSFASLGAGSRYVPSGFSRPSLSGYSQRLPAASSFGSSVISDITPEFPPILPASAAANGLTVHDYITEGELQMLFRKQYPHLFNADGTKKDFVNTLHDPMPYLKAAGAVPSQSGTTTYVDATPSAGAPVAVPATEFVTAPTASETATAPTTVAALFQSPERAFASEAPTVTRYTIDGQVLQYPSAEAPGNPISPTMNQFIIPTDDTMGQFVFQADGLSGYLPLPTEGAYTGVSVVSEGETIMAPLSPSADASFSATGFPLYGFVEPPPAAMANPPFVDIDQAPETTNYSDPLPAAVAPAVVQAPVPAAVPTLEEVPPVAAPVAAPTAPVLAPVAAPVAAPFAPVAPMGVPIPLPPAASQAPAPASPPPARVPEPATTSAAAAAPATEWVPSSPPEAYPVPTPAEEYPVPKPTPPQNKKKGGGATPSPAKPRGKNSKKGFDLERSRRIAEQLLNS